MSCPGGEQEGLIPLPCEDLVPVKMGPRSTVDHTAHLLGDQVLQNSNPGPSARIRFPPPCSAAAAAVEFSDLVKTSGLRVAVRTSSGPVRYCEDMALREHFIQLGCQGYCGFFLYMLFR